MTSLGITIIAADSNKFIENKCYPFSFDCVYGVSQGMFSKNPFFYTVDIEKKHIIGDATPEFVCCGSNNYCLFSGTSKAVPKFLAAIINVFSKEKEISCEKIEEWVRNNSLSAEDNTILCLKGNYSVPFYRIEIYDTLCSYIDECSVDIRKYGEIAPSFNLENLGSHDLAVFIVYIMEKFNIKSKLDDIRYTDFATLGSLCAYIGGQL
jgi:acyl carrier protein